MLKFIDGDVLQPVGEGTKIIAHGCNDVGGFGAGVAAAIAKKWPHVQLGYYKWFAGEYHKFQLGGFQVIPAGNHIWVANVVTQHDTAPDKKGNPPIRYTAVKKGFSALAKMLEKQEIPEISIHVPRIGTGLAGGSWAKIEPILAKALKDFTVYVYTMGAFNA